ncbi:FAD-dependent oxidoreductase [Chloroflexota bacterium]
MNRMFPKLFEPGRIGEMVVKNRIIKAPQETYLGAEDGSVTEKIIRYYEEIASGGAGLVIVEHTWIDNIASRAGSHQLGIASDDYIAGLASLARAIQNKGAKAGLQLSHCGRQKFVVTPPIKAPSRIPWEELHLRGGPVPEELTFEETQEIVDAFGDAAKRIQSAGFDMVEIHGAHGYLITNFLSPRTNRRTDWYGGSLENRMRFLIEIITNVRTKVGPNFPMSVRLSGSEYEPDGVMIKDTIEIAKTLEKIGVDLIHMSGGNHHQMSYEVSPMGMPLGVHVWAAETIKKMIQIPVVASGSIVTPKLAENILQKCKADFISLGRPLWADPYWPEKAEEGRPEDIRPCIRCNEGCLSRSVVLFKPIRCTVNAALNDENELTITPTELTKKIVVVGGGPGGMEAARVNALRGHQVTIYDNHHHLGGRLGRLLEFIPELASLTDYLSTQLEKLGVKIILGKEATVQIIQQQAFDTVILATGAKSFVPEIKGVDIHSVTTADDVVKGKKLGKNVVIVGGDLVGCELAFFLAVTGRLQRLSEYGRMLPRTWAERVSRLLLGEVKLPTFLRKKIRIIEASDEVASGAEDGIKQVIFKGFSKYGVEINLGLRLEEVTKGSVVAVDSNGKRHNFLADSVVFASFAVRNKLHEELERAHVSVNNVGDCVEPRRIYDAIHDGYSVACSIK